MGALAAGDIVQLWLAHARARERAADLHASYESAEQARAIALATEDEAGRGSALILLGLIEHRWGNHATARPLAIEGVKLVGAHADVVRGLAVVGACYYEESRYGEAEEWYLQAIVAARRLNDQTGLSNVLHNLALIKLWQGSFDLTLRYAAEANEIQEHTGGVGFSLPLHGAYVYHARNQRGEAQLAVEALSKATETYAFHRATWHIIQAELALDNEDVEHARPHVEEAHNLAVKQGQPYFESASRATLSRYSRLLGNLPAARAWADEALAHARRTNYRYMEVHSLIEVAHAQFAAGDRSGASRTLDGAIAIADEIGARYKRAHALLLRAIVAADAGGSLDANETARAAWLAAIRALVDDNYTPLLERERRLAFPLTAHWARSGNPVARQSASQILAQLAQVAPLPLHIRGLGEFRLVIGSRTVERKEFQKRRAGELLRFLLLQPNFAASRDSILDALWQDQPPTGGADLLYQTTSHLRRIFEPDLPDKFPSRYLLLDGERVTLRLPPTSSVDIADFRAALVRQPAVLDGAIALYRGDLFPEELYAEWAAADREELAQAYHGALLARARLRLASDDSDGAIADSRTLLRRDPCHEEATLVAMQAAQRKGDRPAALRFYRALQQALDTDFGIAPRSDIAHLAAQLQHSPP